jgi:hypothetical protein
MASKRVPCPGCGKLVENSPDYMMQFCPSCLKGASYFSVVNQFGRHPTGATKQDDARHSGEHLRDMLEKLMFRHPLVIDMDGTMGYGSSFLEAAFTALGRTHAIPPEHFTIRSEDSSLIREIYQYIRLSTSPA